VKVGGVAPKANDTDAEDNRYMSVAVDAKFPEARTLPAPKEDGKPAETDEEKKRKDDLFTTEVTKLKERLAKQQAMAPYTFVVSKFVVDPLLKKRSELMKDKAAPAETPAANIPTPPDGSGDAALMKATSGAAATPATPASTTPAAAGTNGTGKGATAVTPAIEVQPDGKTRVVTEEEMKKAAEEAKAKADAPKKEEPKADAPKAEAPKDEAAKADAPKADAPKP
jgi:ribonuclease E